MELLYATTNNGKLREAKLIFKNDDQIELKSLESFPRLKAIEVEETGDSFTENALIKATAYGQLSKKLTVSEDAGVEVLALDNRPGIHSKRYGPDAASRNQKMIDELADKMDRSAKFVSVLCLFDPQNPAEPTFFKGVLNGRIAHQSKGKDGVDYDFIFIPEGYDQTLAELGLEIKSQISHRQIALDSLREHLLSLKSEQ